MFELLLVGAAFVALLALVGLVGSVLSLVFWVVLLPFKLLAFTFRGLAFLLALPFLLVVAIVGVALFGAGALLFVLPALPIVAVVAFIVWIASRGRRPARTHA